MKVIVCGGRTYGDTLYINALLDLVHKTLPITTVIEGGALGADRLARAWAHSRGIPVQTYNAMWERDGKRAGPVRNRRMHREGRPDAVIAFEGGKGTGDMVKVAREAGTRLMLSWDLNSVADFFEWLEVAKPPRST